jgi:hypothetical protein
MVLAAGTWPRRARAEGAKYRLRYATSFPADHPGVTRIQEAAAAIAKDTSGLVDLQVFLTRKSSPTASSAASRTCSRRSALSRSS